MADLQNRTLICSVLFIDIVEYSRKPVVEQIELKDRFNALLSDALKGVAVNDRIILDTGDGAAISFIGDPEDALFVATGIRDEISTGAPACGLALSTRFGINLGPVRLVKDINGQANIIGDGINVAQRVMSFAKPGQVLVSRSYYEVVSRLSDESSKLFSYEGSRTDKHIREHEVYAVGAIPAMHRRYDDNAVPGWTRSADGSRSRIGRAAEVLRRLAAPVVSRPRAATAVAVIAILATALGARAWREPPPARDTTLLGKMTPLDEGRLSSRVFAPKPPDPEPMRGTPEAARPIAPAPAAEPVSPSAAEPAAPALPPPTPRVSTSREAPPAAPHRKAVPPSRPEAKSGAVVGLADPKAAQPAEKPLPQAAEAELAVLALAITPWGQVVVDGKPRGVSPPLQEIELTPGRHRIELRNTASEPHVITVNAKPGERLRIKHKFN